MLTGGGKHLLTKVSDRLSAEGGWYEKRSMMGRKKVDRNTYCCYIFDGSLKMKYQASLMLK